ncbi:MAG: glycosyltransferase family 4 protein, partial [Acidimicrobiia bacterium]|nr:glycosyltransferase family 4 protein [Acidimicrobiia bacterium]
VELIGRRTHDELPALYAGADAVVVPSVVDRAGDRDGLPNVVLEAMAAGRPVVASTVAAIPCAVVVDGGEADTGLLVPPADPAALRLVLRTLCLDPARRHQLGGNARHRAEAHFDLGRCSAAWVDLLARAHGLPEVRA